MEKRNVYAAIIGGGAAGMMCAVTAARRYPDKEIVILERADRVGKKLLVTGNGRCNLTNLSASPDHYHGAGVSQLINILYKNYSPSAVLDAFRSLGLLTHADSEGRVYPLSNAASSVLDVLRRRMSALRVDELCGVDVRAVRETDHGYEITAGDRLIRCEKLVIATGGHADYAGRVIDSARFLRPLVTALAQPSPSLSPVKVEGDLIRSLKGLRAIAQVSLIRNGKTLKTERGEVQFTDGALSGICIFNLSREANRGGCEIHVNLLPDMSARDACREILRRARMSAPTDPLAGIFIGMCHKNIGLALLKQNGITPSARCQDISEEELKGLFAGGAVLRFITKPNSDFSKAQVTAGGVKLSEIDPATFAAKRHKNLYIIGEALDVDGDCGGYNLQFAWTSGMCAGDHL